VVFEAAVTAEEAFALPERLNTALPVVAAGLAFHERAAPQSDDSELHAWRWDETWPRITTPSVIVEAWGSEFLGSVVLSGPPGLLWLRPNQIQLSPLRKLAGFAEDYQGCQLPIRRLCRAIARLFGTERVLYLPDSGDWPSEVGDLYDTRFDDALARLTAWAPPVTEPGALGYGSAVRSGYHYADGALRRADGTPLTEDEIRPGRDRRWSGGIWYYPDGRLVPAEEQARPDLRGGFAYYVDDFRDLA